MDYIFTSKRLGFRKWRTSDFKALCNMNKNEHVMRFFPNTYDTIQTQRFIDRMNEAYSKNGYCYYAVDRLDLNMFIGFIGLLNQKYPSEIAPFVDIGWRLDVQHWNLGFATEGAKRCLTFGLDELNLPIIYSIAPIINRPSISVMKKIGLKKVTVFKHPKLQSSPKLRNCVLYSSK